MPLDSFCTYSEPFERTRFLIFKRQLKKLNCSILFLLTIYVQNTFKTLHFKVKFCDLTQVGEVRYIARAIFKQYFYYLVMTQVVIVVLIDTIQVF